MCLDFGDHDGISLHIKSKDAQSIERKIDDGKPDTGVCKAWSSDSGNLHFGEDNGEINTTLCFKMDF